MNYHLRELVKLGCSEAALDLNLIAVQKEREAILNNFYLYKFPLQHFLNILARSARFAGSQ
jgi:hypothetical protein